MNDIIGQYTPQKMGAMPPRRGKPKLVLRVIWLGKEPTQVYEKVFHHPDKARQFASTLDDVIILKLETNKKGKGSRWKLMPFGESEGFVKGIRMRRLLKEKKFSNATGEVRPATVPEYQKSQGVRLLDVAFISPVLIYAGTRKEALPNWLRYTLMGIGVATAYYNWRNFRINRQMAKKQ